MNQAALEKKKQEQEISNYILKALIKHQLQMELQKSKTKTGQVKPQDILGIIGGIIPPESVFNKGDVEASSPLGLGSAMGGRVMSEPGATYSGGDILSPGGERVGEYLPGYEPTRATEAFPSLLGQRLGVGEKEAKRKYLGLPLKTEEEKKVAKETKRVESAQKKVIKKIEEALKIIKAGEASDLADVSIGNFIALIEDRNLDPTDPVFADILNEVRQVIGNNTGLNRFNPFRKR